MHTTTIETSGPVFDGRADVALRRYVSDLKEAFGQLALDMIHIRLPMVLEQNRGIYMSKPHTERQADDLVVTDTPIVYGPWLEGTGSRNFPRTRFRGYHTFRKVYQVIDASAEEFSTAKLHEGYLEAMNV